MRTITMFWLLFLMTASHAFGQLSAEEQRANVKNNTCYSLKAFMYFLVARKNDHLYEMQTPLMIVQPHAILRTKKVTFGSLGHPNIMAKRVATKNMEMNDGFSAPVDIWEECQ